VGSFFWEEIIFEKIPYLEDQEYFKDIFGIPLFSILTQEPARACLMSFE